MRLWLLRFTPSIMSISPWLGQLGPTVQKAGQVPQIPRGVMLARLLPPPCLMGPTHRLACAQSLQ